MVHLSEVLGMPVVDAEGARVGRLDDLQVDTVANRVDQVLVRQRKGIVVAFPWPAVGTFSPEHRRARLEEHATPSARGTDSEAVHLKRDVLDRQIIDIQGRKVVRVNDIMLEAVGKDLVLRRVEVGLAGAVRRLLAGILSPRLVRQVAAGLPEQGIWWDYVGLTEPRSSRIRLKVHQHLARMHPADLADIIENLGRVERSAIVSQMDPEIAADALAEAEPSVQAAVVESMHTEQAADVLEEMQPDEAADVLGDLSTERSRELLEAMEEAEAKDVRELLTFGENTAGGLMTTEFFRASAHWTVAETLARLREVDEDLISELDEIPVVADHERFIGLVPLAHIVRADPALGVAAAVRAEPCVVTAGTPFKEVVARFEKYHLRALAVADEFGILAGLISIEDVFSRLVSAD
jgi:sporulation protein YlmC with PRC-barrel domain/CBS-domain-containing membrane protein